MWGVLEFIHKHTHLLLCLLVFIATLTAVGNFQVFVSKQSLSYWDPESSVIWRFLLDSLLLLLFIGQHSFMSTRWFKDKLASWLYITVSERMIYVAATCACLLFTVLQWQSIPETYLWFVDTRERFLLWTFFFLCHVVCWFLLGLEILLMDCSEMLGISQVYRYHSSLSPPLAQKARKLREIYSRMRHPGSLLLTLMLWLHPLMTLDRLLLASVLTTYMIGRHSFEESHYEFAEKYFTVEQVERKSSSSVRYEYVREN